MWMSTRHTQYACPPAPQHEKPTNTILLNSEPTSNDKGRAWCLISEQIKRGRRLSPAIIVSFSLSLPRLIYPPSFFCLHLHPHWYFLPPPLQGVSGDEFWTCSTKRGFIFQQSFNVQWWGEFGFDFILIPTDQAGCFPSWRSGAASFPIKINNSMFIFTALMWLRKTAGLFFTVMFFLFFEDE